MRVVSDTEDIEARAAVEIDQLAKRKLPVAPRCVSVKLAEEERRTHTQLVRPESAYALRRRGGRSPDRYRRATPVDARSE
jgi:hypothetical protein